MSTTHNLGFPRIGAQRELKFAQEAFWRGEISEAELKAVGQTLRQRHWQLQKTAGIEQIPVGDFAWYDQVLTHCALFGAIPPRFGFNAHTLTLGQYFELARGNSQQFAMEMTKWFDTNYHYLVPEWHANTQFNLQSRWILDEVKEALELGLPAKPVLIGPLTFLWQGKAKGDFDKLDLLPRLLPEYQLLLRQLAELGVEWVQIDEPILALDLPESWKNALWNSYRRLALTPPKILLGTYFGDVSEHARALSSLPISGLHLDLVRAPEQLAEFLPLWPDDKVLSLGVINGRNIWRSNLEELYNGLKTAAASLGERLWLAPSCSLQHSPVDLNLEEQLDAELKSWLAFATQKLDEVVLLKHALDHGKTEIAAAWQANQDAAATRKTSRRIHDLKVKTRLVSLNEGDDQRQSPYPRRIKQQQAALRLPLFPTTTIGSFPQTEQIRAARAAFKRGDIDAKAYQTAMQNEIKLVIDKQLQLGLDVLVHGEAERNDMVEYFGEQLAGFAFTQYGWVQSYGSRCVKPPIIYGDVSRPEAMTVDWAIYAQSLTEKHVKGMLTGPVTILQWSFVRDDQPRSVTATQIALAIRDEVIDLEKAGIQIIQIDEPAFREGLPLRQNNWNAYLNWAGRAFRLSAAGVEDRTQIHTHMCYSEFNDILPAIAAMDADVITIETSRSDMELLQGVSTFAYPNDIGPGVYDTHSPRIPAEDEMLRLLHKACAVIPPQRLWVNPDCGLKTRRWPETEAALRNMVQATQRLRESFHAEASIA